MEILYHNIILRDMVEKDIEDWIRWYTTDNEWEQWDGPDLQSEPVDTALFRQESLAQLSQPLPEFRNFFELDGDGQHIGMVSSYPTDQEFQHISWKDARQSGIFCWTLGIDICESKHWGKGYGRNALACFCKHFLDNGFDAICLQTWSGNLRMVRCAEAVGFVVCKRIVGNRHIRGGIYDSLTFRLDLDRFHEYLSRNS